MFVILSAVRYDPFINAKQYILVHFSHSNNTENQLLIISFASSVSFGFLQTDIYMYMYTGQYVNDYSCPLTLTEILQFLHRDHIFIDHVYVNPVSLQ